MTKTEQRKAREIKRFTDIKRLSLRNKFQHIVRTLKKKAGKADTLSFTLLSINPYIPVRKSSHNMMPLSIRDSSNTVNSNLSSSVAPGREHE